MELTHNMFAVNSIGENRDTIVYATKENLEVLKSCDVWFPDGTFDTVPKIFQQLYTIHRMLGESLSAPLMYILLSGKSEGR